MDLSRAAWEGRLADALKDVSDTETSADPAVAWRRGWILAAMGRYGHAFDALGAAGDGPPAVAARALGTKASILRQLNLHEQALAADESALALAACDPLVMAGLRVGLVADGIGLEESTTSLHRRLDEAGAAVRAFRDERQDIRLRWVSGEVALVTGDVDRARGEFLDALERARRVGAARHAAKSALFVAAAHAARGDLDPAAEMAQLARGVPEALPLQWPAALILAEVEQARGRGEQARVHRTSAATVLATVMTGLPADIDRLARRRPPAAWLLPELPEPRRW